MKVLHFFKTYYPVAYGGVQQVIYQLAEGACRCGAEVDVLSLSPDGVSKDGVIGSHRVHTSRQDLYIASTGFSVSAIRDFKQLAEQADVIFVGIGSFGAQSPIVKDGFISHEQLDGLTTQGVIGEILGRFIDAAGQVVDCDSNKLLTSYDIRHNPCPRIAAAHGEDKRQGILAAIKGGWINGLVTDEHTARWLLTR